MNKLFYRGMFLSFIFLYPCRTFGTFKVSASRISLAMHDPRIVAVIGLEVLEDNLTDGTLNTVIEPTEKNGQSFIGDSNIGDFIS